MGADAESAWLSPSGVDGPKGELRIVPRGAIRVPAALRSSSCGSHGVRDRPCLPWGPRGPPASADPQWSLLKQVWRRDVGDGSQAGWRVYDAETPSLAPSMGSRSRTTAECPSW